MVIRAGHTPTSRYRPTCVRACACVHLCAHAYMCLCVISKGSCMHSHGVLLLYAAARSTHQSNPNCIFCAGLSSAAPAHHAAHHPTTQMHNSFSLLQGHEHDVNHFTPSHSPQQQPKPAHKAQAAPPKPIFQLIREVLAASSWADEEIELDHVESYPASLTSLGPLFDAVSLDNISSILTLLPSPDVAALSATCKGFRCAWVGDLGWRCQLGDAAGEKGRERGGQGLR